MTAREKKLSIVVASIVALLLNFFLIQFFLKNQRRLHAEFEAKTAELAAQHLILEEKDLWEKRAAWLASKQPKLITEDGARIDLEAQVTEVCKACSVLLEGLVYGAPDRRAEYVSIPVTFQTKSTWEALCKFLRDMQGLEQFIVFESATLQVDTADKTQMHGTFKVAKWFAPR